MSNFSIFQIAEEYRNLENQLIESGGELTPEIEEALAINQANLTTKAENYAMIIRKYEGMGDVIDAEIKRLQTMKKTSQNLVTRLKDALTFGMKSCEVEKVEVGTFKIGFRKSTSVMVDDEAAIPNEYIKVSTSVDKKALGDALKAGLVISGAHLETKQNISIR